MFRPLMMTSAIVLAAPAFADTFTADARVDAVTIFPGLAAVTRQITLEVPAGRHDIIVPDLPAGLSAQGLRLAATEGAQLGAVNLAFDRLPVTSDLSAPEIVAARAEVERLEEMLRASAARIAEIRLRAEAAEAQIAFLGALAEGQAGALAPSDLMSLSQMMGAEVLAAKQVAFAAEQEAQAADRARRDDMEALAEAKQTLAALTTSDAEGAVLTFTLAAATAGEVTIDITTLEGFANWQPTYEMRLTTGDAPRLDIDRAVVISQSSGQDWNDVRLTLSTARPGEQTGPSGVWAPLRRIIPEDEIVAEPQPMPLAEGYAPQARALASDMAEVAAAPVVAEADFSGATVTYVYPTRVDIRDGVEDLQLPLDRLSFDADVWAEAVPSRDSIAYRMAEFINTTDELLLPGQALIFADGTMLGFSHLPMLAAGADTEMGFGPLDGLRLTRAVPNRMEGDRGVFTTTNELTEAAVITLKNLTGQDWDVLVRDVVPYSEQLDLKVDVTASPAATRRDPDGERGVMEWDLRLPAGDEEVITLDYTLSWPEGYVLR